MMPALLALKLFALANLKSDFGKLWAWLCHRSFWQIVCIALALGWGVDHVVCHRRAAKVEKQLSAATDQLQRITSAKHTQTETTKGTVEKARIIYRDADRRAEKVEQAPLPGECKTPPEVLGAGL